MSTARKLAPGSVLGIRGWRHRMAGHDLRQGVVVSDDDRTVATAEVTTSEGSGGTARVSLRAEPGHITSGRRVSLVDAVLDLPEVQESARMEAAFRLGDSESLNRLQERCQDVRTRPAGWSALVDANLPPGRARSTSQTQPARNLCRAHNDCVQPLRPPEGTANFWWCEPPGRTRMSSRHFPPAASMSSPRCRFSRSLNWNWSRCDRHTRRPDQYAAPCGVAQNLGDGAAVTGQPLVGVATPVGEQQEVTGPQLAHFGRQFGEVGRSMRPAAVPRSR